MINPIYLSEARWLFTNTYGSFVYVNEKTRVARALRTWPEYQEMFLSKKWLALIVHQRVKIFDLESIETDPESRESSAVDWSPKQSGH